MNEREPWLEDQVNARALIICRHDYWPGLTPDKVWELDYDLWARLAIACDRIAAKREQAEKELEERKR